MIVYSEGSGRIRGLLTNCDGEMIAPELVKRVYINIFKKSFRGLTPVEGYTEREVPITTILNAPREDCDGNQYNFDFDPYNGVDKPFPSRNTQYIVEVVFEDENLVKSVHQLVCDSK